MSLKLKEAQQEINNKLKNEEREEMNSTLRITKQIKII